MNELQDVPLWLWFGIAVALMLQGTLLFRDARRRGKKLGSGDCGRLLQFRPQH